MIIAHIASVSFKADEDRHTFKQANNGNYIASTFNEKEARKAIAENAEQVKILLKKDFEDSLQDYNLDINDFDLTFFGWKVKIGSLFAGWDEGERL